MPTIYPPLVTGDPERPGIDIEILPAVADYIGVDAAAQPQRCHGPRLQPAQLGRQPRASARCSPAASSIRRSPGRSSIPVRPTPRPAGRSWRRRRWKTIDGRTLGALTIISGLDRIGLASYLRGRTSPSASCATAEELVDGIAGGAFDGGVTEALLAGGLAADNDWWVASLPDELARYNLVFGLWKGDLTLKRKIVQAFRQLESDGTLAAILERYGAAPIGQGGSVPAL